MSFTRYVGEVGIEGSRIVRPGGIILFNGMKLQHERLLPFVGKEVFCWDADTEIHISAAEYRTYLTTRKPPRRSHAGKLIVLFDSKGYIYRAPKK